MIPKFPKFKSLELSDREEVEKIVTTLVPYSDFNFSNMWAWDIHNKIKISILNGNLVVFFDKYVMDEPVISFVGLLETSKTIEELLLFSFKKYKTNILKLIPEEIITNISDSKKINSIPDRDSFDYVYSVASLACLDRWPSNGSSKRIRNFIKTFQNYHVKVLDSFEVSEDECIEMFKKWSRNKKIENHFDLKEFKAFKRFLQIKDKKIKMLSLYINNELVAFTFYEILTKNYALAHFSKADTTYHSGIYDVIIWEEAKELLKYGVEYYNWEQDLGLKELRHTKEKYYPVFFLKQFNVKLA